MKIRVGLKDGDIMGSTNVAIQAAVDYLAARGGGTLELGPGRYTMKDSLHLKSGIRVVGSGPRTILGKCDGPESPLAIDADYGQLKLTPKRPAGFEVGMGVSVGDSEGTGWHTSCGTIIEIKRRALYVDRHFVSNYRVERDGYIRNAVAVISGVDVEDVAVENLVVDGNKRNNAPVNGCIAAGIYFCRARRCRVANCTVRNFNGDGISYQTDQDIHVEKCTVERCTNLGIHPGSGSARTVVRNCVMRSNGNDGLFLCWRVQNGLFENCRMEGNGRHGISIGHKDTDNLFRNNVMLANGRTGIFFRPDKASNAGSRNRFENNRIERSGRKHASGAVEVHPATKHLVFTANTIRPGKMGRAGRGQIAAFLLHDGAEKPRLARNKIARHRDGVVACD